MVYFIGPEDGAVVKIGVAEDATVRLRDLQVGSPVKLFLIAYMAGDRQQERTLHDQFSLHRLHGEWFEVSKAMIQFARKNADVPERSPWRKGERSPRKRTSDPVPAHEEDRPLPDRFAAMSRFLRWEAISHISEQPKSVDR